MLPRGPVMKPFERYEGFAADRLSGARYGAGTGLPLDAPILPLMPFGLTYELDIVVMTRHPSWNMHEYALIRTSAGLIWLLKDSREGTMEQTIIADVDGIDDWMPEVPVQRRQQSFDVLAETTDRCVSLELAYTNWDGEHTEVMYSGAFPRSLQRKRNGSTMRHSQNQLMAVLDLSHQNTGSAQVSIGGVRQKPARLFGVPVSAALQQTQGGLVTGSWLQEAAAGGFTTAFTARSGAIVPRTWSLETLPPSAAPGAEGLGVPSVWAVQDDADRQLAFRFLQTADGALELRELRAWQKGQAAAGFNLSLSPALPDLRRPFDGPVTVRWAADVAGQLSHATGVLIARWTDDGPELELRPEAPWWVWDRPMLTTVRPESGGARVTVERIATSGQPPSNRACTWPADAT